MSHFIVSGSNRYFLNDAQRQQLIKEELQNCCDDGWAAQDVENLSLTLNSYTNKQLVEDVCGCQWRGFIGQTLESA